METVGRASLGLGRMRSMTHAHFLSPSSGPARRRPRALACILAVMMALGACPGQAAEDRAPQAGEVLVDGDVFHSLKAAFEAARPFSRIRIGPGDWLEAVVVTAEGVVIEGKGAHLRGRAAEGKAAIVVRADNVEIRGIECSGIAVPDRNGACVRLEGRNLALSGVHFHDSEEGLLTGPDPGMVAIWDSRFERLGRAGRAHGIYVGGGKLHISRSFFLSARDQGHEIKSRAAETIIEDSVIASLGGADSRLIDVANGGRLVIRRSVLEEGPASVNSDMIGYGLEGMAADRSHRIEITDSLIVNDKDRPVTFLARPKGAALRLLVIGNVFVGRFRDAIDERMNRLLAGRKVAGLPPAPALPELPLALPAR